MDRILADIIQMMGVPADRKQLKPFCHRIYAQSEVGSLVWFQIYKKKVRPHLEKFFRTPASVQYRDKDGVVIDEMIL